MTGIKNVKNVFYIYAFDDPLHTTFGILQEAYKIPTEKNLHGWTNFWDTGISDAHVLV